MKESKGLLCRFQEKTQHQESPQAHHQKEIPQTWNSIPFYKLFNLSSSIATINSLR